jgi:hypothetical protein
MKRYFILHLQDDQDTQEVHEYTKEAWAASVTATRAFIRLYNLREIYVIRVDAEYLLTSPDPLTRQVQREAEAVISLCLSTPKRSNQS